VFLTFGGGAALGTQEAGAGEAVEHILAELASEYAAAAALRALVQAEFKVLGYAGSSVGGVLAIMRSFGIPWGRINELFKELLAHNKLLDFSLEGIPGGAVTKWEVLKDICERELGAAATFGDAPLPLVVGATSADTASPFYFSKRFTPKVKVSEVVTRTSAVVIPLADMDSVPSLGTELSPDIRLFYDIGWTDNTSDHVFDDMPEARIAIRLERMSLKRVRKGDYAAMLKSYGRAALYAASAWKSRRQRDGLNISLPVVYDTGFDFSKTAEQVDKEWQLGAEQVLQQREAFRKFFV
jgi:hypothetical protein